jgi:hypothetical protein
LKQPLSSLKAVLAGTHRRLRDEYRRIFISPIGQIHKNARDVAAWIDLVDRERRAGRLPERTAALVASHEISRVGVVHYYLDEISRLAGSVLDAAAVDPVNNVPRVADEIVRWKTVIQCRDTHSGAGGYYAAAEPVMAWQWENVIWPIIAGSDFSVILELAPGHGRNTELLRRQAKEIHLVDVNQSCLDACKARFGDQAEGCRFFFHLTDGTSLRSVADASITFGYSWDSMVHFDKIVVRGYIFEFARVLKPGGRAFLHMSNYGATKPDSDWASNPGTRSDMSAALLRQYAQEAGLTVPFQRLSGRKDGWGLDDLDCLSVVERPVG